MRLLSCVALTSFAPVLVLAAPSPRSSNRLPIASNVLPLRRSTPKQLHSSITRRQNDDLVPPAAGVGVATDAARGVAYITDVEVGGDTYSLIVDTGSSDTWLAKHDFVCLDILTRAEVPIEQCRLGPLFQGEFPGGPVDDLVFNITYGYAGGPTMAGSFGYAK